VDPNRGLTLIFRLDKKEIVMKKTARKLNLSRETLRHLEEGTLPAVVGAAVTQIDCTRANGSCISTAPTCFCTQAIGSCAVVCGG
jgi:hypothetical protein